MDERPSIARLTRRLADTPTDFLRNDIDVAAIVSDLLVACGGAPLSETTAKSYRKARPTAAERNRRACTAVAAWLLHDAQLRGAAAAALVLGFLEDGIAALHPHVAAADLVGEADRREELSRLALRWLRVVPDGETPEQAADRLSTLDSAERSRVLEAAREAERRAEEVRRAMHERAAAEAAAKASRE